MLLEARPGARCSRVGGLHVRHAWDFGLIAMGIAADVVIADSSFADVRHAGVHVMRKGAFTEASAHAAMKRVSFVGDAISELGARGVCACADGGFKDAGCLFPNPSAQSYPVRTTKVRGKSAASRTKRQIAS